MNELDKTKPLTAYRPKGEEIIVRRERNYRRPLLIGAGGLLALWVGLSGLGAAFGPGEPAPASPRPPAQVRPEAPAPAVEEPDTAYDTGRELGRAYNDVKKNSESFLEGFTDETTVDETWDKVAGQVEAEVDRQLKNNGR